MSGDASGTGSEGAGTSGSRSVTSGNRRLAIVAIALLFAIYGGMEVYANVSSIIADTERSGGQPVTWMIWALEGSSLVGWTCVIALLWLALPHILPPRRSWPMALALLAAGAFLASALHVGLMVGLREAIWAAKGVDYVFPSGIGGWPYELRKDLPDYLLFVLILSAARWYLGQSYAPSGESRVFTAVDGARRIALPYDEIDHVEAAGNYVEIHSGERTILHRATMQAIEGELSPYGFARIHRSRLVRKAAVRQVETVSSGDFEVTLSSGALLRGSRRYRDALN
ncbi:LytTR family DNA-binding domain-containing protein [Parerythrobacter aestuarii]|uniref:LytTR family DNA-binding domain-containing protein n=1 Tax=Parerythrobacter aestuarii TaxID=3020909 RepID=UPI0024DE4E8C|nr:LytTR family DNA-binding domain-containing protein [Parerythrobacter aestuarii]